MAVRGLGCPVRFALTTGQKGDAPQAEALLADLPAVGDGRQRLRQRRHPRGDRREGRLPVVPNNPSRAQKHPVDQRLYAMRP